MATKKTIIGCNKFNDKSSISNSNWTTNLRQSLTLNAGDTISVKTSFIDTRNKIAGYYTIPKDVIISMDYYFYYINRGGNQITSNQIADETGTTTNQQCIACDTPTAGRNIRTTTDNEGNQHELPFPQFTPNATDSTFTDPRSTTITYSQYISKNHTAFKTQTLPITNDTTTTGKIPSNLSPLLESVYHCYSNVNVDNTKTQYFTQQGNFNQSAFSNNPSGFNTTIDVQSGDGLPYLLHYYVPENVGKNYVVTPVNFTDMVIGQTYSIIKTGNVWNNGFDTDWLNIASTLTAPSKGVNFVCESNVNEEYTFTDITKFDTVNSFIITSSIGIDYSLYGGPSLPENTNPIIDINLMKTNDWVSVETVSIPFRNITPIQNGIDYNLIFGINTIPTIKSQYISIIDMSTYVAPNLSLLQLNAVDIGMVINVTTVGAILWDELGFINPTPNPIIFVYDPTIIFNTYYKVINIGLSYGINNAIKDTIWGEYSNTANPSVGDIVEIIADSSNMEYTNATIYNVNDFAVKPSNYYNQRIVIVSMGTSTTGNWVGYILDFPRSLTIGTIIQLGSTFSQTTLNGTGATFQILQNAYLTVGLQILVTVADKIDWALYNNGVAVPNMGNLIIQSIPDYTQSIINGNNPTAFIPMNDVFEVVSTGLVQSIDPDTIPFSFTVSKIPTIPFTDDTFVANIVPIDTIQEIIDYTFPLPAFRPTSQIQGGSNSSFEATVVSTGKVGTEDFTTNVYDNKALNTGKMKPFTKNFKFKIKAGSYSPEYLAEILSRAMSVQKPKQNIKNGKIKISTPIVNINEQMMDIATLQTEAENARFIGPDNSKIIAQWNADGYSGITGWAGSSSTTDIIYQVQNIPCPSHQPYLNQGGFPYTALGQIDTYANLPLLWQNYIGNNQFVPKNQNILPTGQNLDNTKLPINPKYSENDFNFNGLLTGDDTPFIYRPNAYGTRSDYNPSHMNIKLTYNDANLEYMNDLQPFGKKADNSIRNIEMAYKPLCHDAGSDYFESIQSKLGLVDSIDYSIRPVVSVPFTQIGVLLQDQSSAGNYTSACPIGIRNLSSPIVGSTQMSVTYGDENNNLFSFPYLHTGIYSKEDPTTNSTVESIAIYKNTTNITTTDVNGLNPIVKKINSVFQCESQSGLLLKNISAKFLDGTSSSFWEDLGFDVNAITAQNNKSTFDDDTFTIPYNDFLIKTTRGFSGTANTFDNQSKCDLNEISPISYFDSYTMSGFPMAPTYNNNNNDDANGDAGVYFWYTNNYSLYTQPLYFSVEKTKSVDASKSFTNLSDTGHVLLSVEGYGGQLINSETKMNIKSIISSYYSSANFITNPNPEEIVYEHTGLPLDINNLKIVLIDPFTNDELSAVGPNSSIYFTVNQQLQFQNTNQKKK